MSNLHIEITGLSYLGLRLQELVSQIEQLLITLYLTGVKCSLNAGVYRWQVTKFIFFSSLIEFCAISYENVTYRILMLLLALLHLPCGYTLPAISLLVKSNDKLHL